MTDHLNQRHRVIEQFRKNGCVTRNWAVRNYITRLSDIIFKLRAPGKDWKIETVETHHPSETTYYLVWKPGMEKEVEWPEHVSSRFVRAKEESPTNALQA